MTRNSRFVFDTNVLASAALRRHSIPRQALDHALERGVVLVSEATVREFQEVLFRPQFDKYVTEQTRLLFLTTFLSQAEVVDITEQVTVCHDLRDNKFLEVAVNGNATCIVSGDEDLLVLHPFRTVPIVTPRTFLAGRW